MSFTSSQPQVGTELTASLSDPDGEVTEVSWQWASSATADGAFSDLSGNGAATASYTPQTADIDQYLQATASYTDPQGSGKSASAVLGNAVPKPPPAAPSGLTATPGNGQATLSWNDPDDATIIGYEYQQKEGPDGVFGTWQAVPGSGAATTTYTVLDLTNGIEYSFLLRSVSVVGESPDSAPVSASPSFPAPNSLTATPGDRVVVLSWDYVDDDNITGHELERGDFPGRWISVPDSAHGGSHVASYRYTALTNGVEYSFRLRTVRLGFNSVVTPAVTAIPHEADSTVVPYNPPGLRATPGVSEVTLHWVDPANSSITGYEYQQKAGGGSSYSGWTPVPGSGAATTTYTVPSLTIGTEYSFRVRAVNPAGNSDPSDTATATPVPLSPEAPTGFNLAPQDSQVWLRWNPLEGATGGWRYWIRKGSGESSWNAVPESDANTVAYLVTGLDNDSVYRFRIRAVNAAGEGPQTAPQAATPKSYLAKKPLRPRGLSAVAGTAQATLSWYDPNDDTINLYQYRLSAGGGWKGITGSGPKTVTHTVRELDSGTTYQIRIRSRNSVEFAQESDPVSVTLLGNRAPTAVADSATTDEDTLVDIDVVGNDTDPDAGDTLSVTEVTSPTNGTAAVKSGSTTEVTYTPNTDFNGSDNFDYTVSDGSVTATGTVTVTVNAVNDAPEFAAETAARSVD